jgi:hemolysin III
VKHTLHGAGPTVEPVVPPKPRFRGLLHQIAFFLAIPAGIVLVAIARGATARTSAIIYAVSLAGLYASSASYHRIHWSPRALKRMQRLDHSMIYMLIAGTYTPFALLVLHGPLRLVMLILVWAGAVAGVVMKVVRIDRTQVFSAALYVVLGWLAVVAAPQMLRNMSGVALGLLIGGGILYTSGAVVLARRRPDPAPATFGYHEIWHSMVVGASACHYAVVLLVVLAARP